MKFIYHVPTRVIYGSGSLEKLSEQDLPGKKALIVTGGTSVKRFGYLSKLTAQLKLKNIEFDVFDAVLPNPIEEHVGACTKMCKAMNADFVIGIGGGSAIDTAKAVAVMATNDGELWDYVSGGSGKGGEIKKKPLPIVAIPTTAGTGTEADPWAVITKNGEKIGFGFEGTYPTLSIVDPTLTLSVPPHLTAYQGFDALFHSTESYINKFATPICDMYCENAISLIGANLKRVVEFGGDIEAREKMSLAALMSGYAESQAGCTSSHSIEHALSAAAPKLEHGAGLVMIALEYYRFFIENDACPERFIAMARLLGHTEAQEPDDFLTALSALIADAGLGGLNLSSYGIKKEQLKGIATIAYETMGGLFECDRVPLDFKDTLRILEKSYK